jgi:hypothetical protein
MLCKGFSVEQISNALQRREKRRTNLIKLRKNSMVVFGMLSLLVLFPAIARGELLLILAPAEFMDELLPLKLFKDATARPTILLNLTDVYNNFTGADQAEKVKKCIEYYQKTRGIGYVMLVGDIDKFPGRWAWWGWPSQEGWGMSDLYYADLYKKGTSTFDAWDSNSNALYGEVEFSPDGTINNDNIDYLPDVAVGRIPASTEAEVTAYVNKVINYELNTHPSDAWFKKAALYTGDWLPANVTMDEIGQSLASKGFTLTKRYTDWTASPPTTPPGVPGVIVNDLNGGVGFVNYIGHGNTSGLASLGFWSGTLTQLNNSSRLPVVFAGACDTSGLAWLLPFGPYIDVTGQKHCGTGNGESLPLGTYPHPNLPRPASIQAGSIQCPVLVKEPLCTSCTFDPECFGEKILFGNPTGSTGAIAYLGERSGGQATVPDLSRHFFQAYVDGHSVLGDMWKQMIEKYYDQHGLAQSNTWFLDSTQWPTGHMFTEPQKLIVFGDPSLVVGGGVSYHTILCGNAYDGNGGPLASNYYVSCDIVVPASQRLTAISPSLLQFDRGRKITAWDASPGNGFIVNGSPTNPVRLFTLSADPHATHRGIVVSSQLRLRQGGSIKFY